MRQSKAVGRTVVSARRVALTTLGAGLVVGAAAPVASAASLADETAPASSTAFAQSALTDTPLTNTALNFSEAALSGAAHADWSRLGHFKLYPLAGTGLDPLSNTVATNLGGIPVSTQPVSQMVEDGLPVSDLPVVSSLFSAPQAHAE